MSKPAGRRPVLLLSRDDAYSYRHKFIAAEITTNVRNIPVEIPLGRREGLPKACAVNCDNLRTRISRLAPHRLRLFDIDQFIPPERVSHGALDLADPGVAMSRDAAR